MYHYCSMHINSKYMKFPPDRKPVGGNDFPNGSQTRVSGSVYRAIGTSFSRAQFPGGIKAQ